jgi:predicted RNA-binding Zn ribbon-like protein
MPFIGYSSRVANPPFEWIGGDPSIDFHNTVTWGRGVLSEERFRSPADLREWARGAALAVRPSAIGRGLLGDALGLRDVLHRLFGAIALRRRPRPGDVAAFNRFLRRAVAGVRLERESGGFGWTFAGSRDLDPLLAEVVWSAARLLSSPDLERLRACANPTCGWLFLDRSRRGNRRWCEMRECGNRAKARRYYRRHRAPKVGSVSPDYS